MASETPPASREWRTWPDIAELFDGQRIPAGMSTKTELSTTSAIQIATIEAAANLVE